jgi:hypothetical protein
MPLAFKGKLEAMLTRIESSDIKIDHAMLKG